VVCENCGQNPASVHLTQVMGNQRSEVHLCESCARERGFVAGVPGDFGSFGISNLLSSLLGGVAKSPVPSPGAQRRCPNCGMTFSQFSDGGLLGCAQCYDAMERELEPLVRRIHGTTRHTGKVPRRTGGLLRLKRDLAALRSELERAIANEEFEKAAQIRDRVRALEAKLAGGDGNVVE
jgi:protein arginine kinase activator